MTEKDNCTWFIVVSVHHIRPGQFVFGTCTVITPSQGGLWLDVRLVSLCPVCFPPSLLEGL